MTKNNFYDTSSLLLKAGHLFDDDEENIYISSITLEELEKIKTSSNKDAEVKYAARQVTRELDEYWHNFYIIQFKPEFLIGLEDYEINNDLKIISCVVNAKPDKFITNDLCCRNLARIILPPCVSVESYENSLPEYTGYKEIYIDQDELIDFYEEPMENKFALYINEYLILKDKETKEVLDIRIWNGEEYQYINSKPINSKWFGKINAYKGDIYQKLAIDSLYRNQLTVFRGIAGTGKSILGLSYLFSLLEDGKIDKIYIFCNPVATKDAAKLGFYPGDKDTKLLDSQVGNFLVSKFGDYTAVERLVTDGKLVLVPAADCRGMDICANSGVYITEAQNSTIDMMKLMVQRIGEGTKCVIEGDDKAQVDLNSYEGTNNGLSRLSQVFRGQPYYGEVTLQNCYRSTLAKQAELM